MEVIVNMSMLTRFLEVGGSMVSPVAPYIFPLGRAVDLGQKAKKAITILMIHKLNYELSNWI